MRSIFPLLLGAFALALPGCGRNSGAASEAAWWERETRRIELAQQVELLRLRLDRHAGAATDGSAIRAEVAATDRQLAELAADRAELRADLAELDERIAEARQQGVRRARVAAVGLTFDTFPGKGGRSYREVRITRVTDIGIEFRHRDGAARIAAADLTAEQQDRFGLDPDLSNDAQAKEAAQALAYDHWVDGSLAAQEAADEKERRDGAGTRPMPAAAAPVTLSARRRTRLDEPTRAFGSSSYYYPYFSRYSTYTYTPVRSSCYRPSFSRPQISLVFGSRPAPSCPTPRPLPPRSPSIPHVLTRSAP